MSENPFKSRGSAKPQHSAQRLLIGRVLARLQPFYNLQASKFAAQSHPPLASNIGVRAVVGFTSVQHAVRYLPAHRICYPSEIRQLTAAVSHLLDLLAALGLPPAGIAPG